MSKRIVTVLGATGAQGGSVARALLTHGGYHVRAVTRDPSKKSAQELLEFDKKLRGGSGDARVELVSAELNDEASLRRVFDGAYGVFAVTNFWEDPVMEKEFFQGMNVAHAAKATNIKHLVWSSLEFSYVPHFTSKAMVESYIDKIGVPYTAVLLPAYFVNFIGFPAVAPRRQADGSFVFSMPFNPEKGVIPLFSVADTGAFVLEALNHPEEYLGKQMRIASDVITLNQLAATFQEVTGIPCRAAESDHEAFKNMFPGAIDLYLNFKWFSEDRNLRDVEWSRRVHPQIKDWAAFVRDNTDYFKNIEPSKQ